MAANNIYIDYYANQAGNGIPGFEGIRYQRGGGFFGKLLSSAIYPLLRFMGRKALKTGVNIAEDVLGGENIKSSAKRRAKDTGIELAETALGKAHSFLTQRGKGVRRKRIMAKRKAKKRGRRKTKRSRVSNVLTLLNKASKRKPRRRTRRKNKITSIE